MSVILGYVVHFDYETGPNDAEVLFKSCDICLMADDYAANSCCNCTFYCVFF